MVFIAHFSLHKPYVMKKILLIGVLVMVVGCGKKKSVCYSCTLRYYNSAGVTDPAQDEESPGGCFDNDTQIRAHEAANTKGTAAGGKQVMTCKEQ